MKLLAFAASLRTASVNRKLIQQAAVILREIPKIDLDLADFLEFEMPMYDGDLEERDGIPQGGLEFIRRMQRANGLVIAMPEYNGGVPGTLKNAIDWASRTDPIPFEGKPVLLIGASPGGFGSRAWSSPLSDSTSDYWSVRLPSSLWSVSCAPSV